MVFSSILFLIYALPIFLLGFYCIPAKYRDFWTVTFSLLFYTWGAPEFILIALSSSLLDYFIALKIKGNKKLLLLGVLLNVAMLGYFKYTNFLMDNWNQLLSLLGMQPNNYLKVLLPIGISFFTFQKISYLVDVYRGDCPPQNRLEKYLLFIFLFPQLIAGPIIKFKDLNNQILKPRKVAKIQIYNGIIRFIIGLSKKVLVANPLGAFVDANMDLAIHGGNGTVTWLVLVFYSFQIYMDFSGYSDMAIGLGKMMGFRFPENFNFPYLAKSITEFWRRWHITLGQWMKDYLYIPLGGNQKGKYITYVNLLVVFTISGIWHGASWNFLIWGMFHGSFLLLERAFLGRYLSKIGNWAILYNFIREYPINCVITIFQFMV